MTLKLECIMLMLSKVVFTVAAPYVRVCDAQGLTLISVDEIRARTKPCNARSCKKKLFKS